MGTKWRGPRALGLALGLTLLFAPAARGEEPPPPGPAATEVEVVLVGDYGRDPALAALVAEWLTASHLRPTVTRSQALVLAELRAAPEGRAPVRLWLVPVDAQTLRVFLAEPSAERYLVRELPVPAGLDEIGRERVAQVVLSSALAFLEGASSPTEEVERAVAPAAVNPPAEPTPAAPGPATPRAELDEERETPRARTTLGAGLRYGVAPDAALGAAHGPGLVLGLGRARGRWRAGAYGVAEAVLPREVETEHLTVTLRGLTLEGGLEGSLALGRGFEWQLAAGGGLERRTAAPAARDDTVIVTATDRASVPHLRLAFGPAWRGPRVGFALLAHVAAEPVGIRYHLVEGSTPRDELVPPRVKPGATVVVRLEHSVHPTPPAASPRLARP